MGVKGEEWVQKKHHKSTKTSELLARVPTERLKRNTIFSILPNRRRRRGSLNSFFTSPWLKLPLVERGVRRHKKIWFGAVNSINYPFTLWVRSTADSLERISNFPQWNYAFCVCICVFCVCRTHSVVSSEWMWKLMRLWLRVFACLPCLNSLITCCGWREPTAYTICTFTIRLSCKSHSRLSTMFQATVWKIN